MANTSLDDLVRDCPECSEARALLRQLVPCLYKNTVSLVGRPDTEPRGQAIVPLDCSSLRIGCDRCGGRGRLLTDEGRMLAGLLRAEGLAEKEED